MQKLTVRINNTSTCRIVAGRKKKTKTNRYKNITSDVLMNQAHENADTYFFVVFFVRQEQSI